ncbi:MULTISPECIES: MerR family transcriptional regulator [unclassified Rhizobium]|uniref:MerR family transcriptional regulator n=1 Tax=unclassified Rhizobium TaxID=2613769 RepID=UPI0006F49BE6|nr:MULTISPECIES: MerR family transcriptional regulator [unclassified Rhizobium]KQV34586.1 LuxR family transcriptional regulator [Rhizobium sp. Root1212]KRD23920.1 LuxR family transcriptional regulator [Rhizobium sp. Root268]
MQEEMKLETFAPRAQGAYLPQLPLPGNIPENQVAIADMADAFGVTHRTLHFYEEKGLLTANRMGPMRVYGLEDIRRMAVINACREIDMPIVAIQELMAALVAATSQEQAAQTFRDAMHAHKRELAAQQSILRRQMQRVSELLESAEDGAAERQQVKPIHLSPIELKCVAFMAEGYPATRIAALMNMDLTAVLTLESDIIRKFNGHNRFQAVAKAVLMGFVSAD